MYCSEYPLNQLLDNYSPLLRRERGSGLDSQAEDKQRDNAGRELLQLDLSRSRIGDRLWTQSDRTGVAPTHLSSSLA